jgi:hypothetical protein
MSGAIKMRFISNNFRHISDEILKGKRKILLVRLKQEIYFTLYVIKTVCCKNGMIDALINASETK